jgi:hypothetical protein
MASLVSAAAGILIVIHCWEQRKFLSLPAFRDLLEGRLLAFSSLAIYPLFLWCIASWMIMGSPFYFLVNDRAATSLAGGELSGYGIMSTGLLGSAYTIFNAWYITYPVGLLAFLVLIFIGFHKHSAKYIGFAVVSLTIPLLQYVMLLRQTTIPLLRYFITSSLFGFILMAIVFSALRKDYHLNGARMQIISALAVLLVLGSNFATAHALDVYPYVDMEKESWQSLTTPHTVQDQNFTEAYQIGKLLPKLVEPGKRVLIDTYQYGFGVMLGANNPKMFMDFTDPNYDQAVLNPARYADYVMVPDANGRGALYTVNREFPNLHDSGATWATLVNGLPDTLGQWRLYKVKK